MIKGLEHLSYEGRLNFGVVQPREARALGKPYSSLRVPKGSLQKS